MKRPRTSEDELLPTISVIPKKRCQWKPDQYNVHLLVFLADIEGMNIHEMIDLINRVMRREGFAAMIDNGDTVLNHSRFGSSCWCLRVASEELTEYVCYMNGMLYKNRELQLQPNKGCPSPRYNCWNEYYLERYGKNDPMIESQVIVDAKNKQSVDGDLFIHALEKVMIKHGFENDGEPIKSWLQTGPASFTVEMHSSRQAERLCRLEKIIIDNSVISLRRAKSWRGPSPRHNDYQPFLLQNSIRTKKQEMNLTVTPERKTVLCATSEDWKDIKAENELLKGEILIKGNDLSVAKKEIERLQKEVANRDEEIQKLKQTLKEAVPT